MRLFIVLSLLMLSSCKFSEYENAENLIGTWIINHAPGSVNYSFIEYDRYGDKCEITFSVENSLEVDMYWNKWQLIDGIIYSTMHNTTTFIEFGYKIQDKIQKLTDEELFIDMVAPAGDYSTEYHYKNKNAEPGQVCATVKKFFKNKSKI